MKIIALADTHGFHNQIVIPDGDVVIFAGDICQQRHLESLKEFSAFLYSLPHSHKIIIAGNHDFPFLDNYLMARKLIERVPGAIYLQDNRFTIDGVNFYGSPWTSIFFNWAFMLAAKERKQKWNLIPPDTDVLITHGPPAGVLDLVNGVPLGCSELLSAVKRVNPKYHIFGHIHECYGIRGNLDDKQTTFVNASICNGLYQPDRIPFQLELHVQGNM